MSMICTLSPGHGKHGRATAFVAAVAIALGCIAGGIALFIGLAAVGQVLWSGAPGPFILAGAVAIATAVLDVAGINVKPQIRSQVPEGWRRHAPLSVASGAYGILLGLGFTTFVMSYALWGVALLSVLIGSPALGVALGIAFGSGRALPILALAPWADRPWALTVQEAMSQRPATLRMVRATAACLVALAVLGTAGSPALAATGRVVAFGTDPSADGTQLAFRKRGGADSSVFLRDLAQSTLLALPGRLLVVGDGLRAHLDGGVISVHVPRDPIPRVTLAAPPGVDALAVSDGWLAYRVAADPPAGRRFDQIVVRRVDGSGTPRVVAWAAFPNQLGRPALSHRRLAYHVSSSRRSRIVVVDLVSGAQSVIERRGAQVLFPAVRGNAVVFVEVTACRQRLLLKRGRFVKVLARRVTFVRRDSGFSGGAARVSRSPSHCRGPRHVRAGQSLYWQTALTDDAAYLTIIDAVAPRRQPFILEIPR